MQSEGWPEGALAKHLAEPPPAGWTGWEWGVFCRALAEGQSYGKASAAVGKSKNAGIGIAHRRGLPARESWIGRGFGADEKRAAEAKAREGRKAQARAVKEERLAQQRARAEEVASKMAQQAEGRRAEDEARAAERLARAKARAAMQVPRLRRSDDGCRWPFGDPKEESFRFCAAAEVVVGCSYCPVHRELAYTRTAAEVERAAAVARQVVGTAQHRPFVVARVA